MEGATILEVVVGVRNVSLGVLYFRTSFLHHRVFFEGVAGFELLLVALQVAHVLCVDTQTCRSTTHDTGIPTTRHVTFRLGLLDRAADHLVTAEAFTCILCTGNGESTSGTMIYACARSHGYTVIYS